MKLADSLFYSFANATEMWPVLALGALLVLALALIFFYSARRPPVFFSRDGIRYSAGFWSAGLDGSSDEMIRWAQIVATKVGRDDGDHPVQIELRSGEQRRIGGLHSRRLAVQLAAEVAYYVENSAARDSLPEPRLSVAGARLPVSDIDLEPYRRAVR